MGVFLLSLIYREGGLLLALGWNASRWGAIFGFMASSSGEQSALGVAYYLLRLAACVLPHMLVEATAYVLVAMAGVFVSQGLARYGLGSDRQIGVVGAALRLGLGGVVGLIAAAWLEARFAPFLVRLFFGP